MPIKRCTSPNTRDGTAWSHQNESAQTVLQTKYGKFHWHVFSWSDNEQDNVMVLAPETVIASVPLVRVQSACYSGEIFGSLDCDCH